MTDNSERFSFFLKRPFSTFLLLWAPLLFSLVAEALSGLVDTVFVARLGADELAALWIGTLALTSCLWIFNFLCVGTQTAVVQALGKKDLTGGGLCLRDRRGCIGAVGISVFCATALWWRQWLEWQAFRVLPEGG